MTAFADPASLAYSAFCRGLREHPLLAGKVKTWRFRDGSTKADDPPVAANCPWVRLTPAGGPIEFSSRRAIATPLEIQIETAVATADFFASSSLWGRLLVAIFSQDDADSLRLRQALKATGVSGFDLQKPAIPDGVEGYGDGPLVATGSILLRIYRRLR